MMHPEVEEGAYEQGGCLVCQSPSRRTSIPLTHDPLRPWRNQLLLQDSVNEGNAGVPGRYTVGGDAPSSMAAGSWKDVHADRTFVRPWRPDWGKWAAARVKKEQEEEGREG